MERRWIVFLLLCFVLIQIFALLNEKQRPKGQTIAGFETTGTALLADGTTATAVTSGLPASAPLAPAAARLVENTSITVLQHPGAITTSTTAKYEVGIDHVGAVVNSWRLLDPGSVSFRKSLESNTSHGVEMVRRIPLREGVGYVPQTWPFEIGLTEQNSRSYEDFNNVEWNVEETSGANLHCVSPVVQGVRIKKWLEFQKDQYRSTLRITVSNDNPSTVSFYDGVDNRGLVLRWGPGLTERTWAEKSGEEMYDTSVYRANGEVVTKTPAPEKDPLSFEGPIDWAGVQSKFFAMLIAPEQPDDAAKKRSFFFRALVPGAHNVKVPGFTPPLTMELGTESFMLGPGESRSFSYDVYLGPKKFSTLKGCGHQFQTLMFSTSWPFMRAIYLFLTDFLNWIYSFVGNYGIAIILLTVAVRLCTFPLTQHSIRIQAKTMAEQQKVKPYIDQINEKYKDDPQEKNRQIWKVYQEHGISPFGALRGCIPMLLQLPVFYGLYRVSNDTIDLKGAHFLWIQDLSLPDHLLHFSVGLPIIGQYFNLLPVLMAATQLLATWVASARVKVQDPTQKQMMYMMPVMFLFVLWNMPAGLMLYWIASNVWQIGQTIVTNRIMAREEQSKVRTGLAVPFTPAPAPPEKRSGKNKR